MKKDLHPQWYPNAKVYVNNEVVMTVGSTVPEIHVEVWSGNHPFFTGKQQLLDTTGNVDKFRQRVTRAAQAQAQKKEKKPRKARGAK
jgi:large subunit ribosomal protein L31